MTESTDRVLASIDEAIDGYISEDDDVSYDAMRWRPDAPAELRTVEPALVSASAPSSDARPIYSPPTAYWAPMGALSEGPGAWTPLGYVADGGFETVLADHAAAARRLDDHLTVTFHASLDAVRAVFASLTGAFGQVGREFSKVVKANHPAVARLEYREDYRRHRRACRLCNPGGNPKPLAVNGAEYRRRTRARRRRNRR